MPDFATLYRYCYRVASAVGLACIHIWGFRERCREAAGGTCRHRVSVDEHPARFAGRLGATAGFICRPRTWSDSAVRAGSVARRIERAPGGFAELMRFEVRRARDYYRSAERLDPAISIRRAGPSFRSCCGPIVACSTRSNAAISTCSASASG